MSEDSFARFRIRDEKAVPAGGKLAPAELTDVTIQYHELRINCELRIAN